MAKNLYCTPADLALVDGAHQSADASLIMGLLEAASRWVDEITQRHYFVEQATRYFPSRRMEAHVDDLLAVTAMGADSERDGTFDGESWIEGTDYRMEPLNSWPRMRLVQLPDGDYSMPDTRHSVYLRITGAWGYGDGESASPWAGLPVTGTVATADGTTLTLSAAGSVTAGMTIKLGDEQMAVQSVVTTSATVTRGINGTTAAAHTAAAVSRASYPARIELATRQKALDFWHEFGKSGETASEWVGSYNYMRMTQAEATERDRRMVGPYIRRA